MFEQAHTKVPTTSTVGSGHSELDPTPASVSTTYLEMRTIPWSRSAEPADNILVLPALAKPIIYEYIQRPLLRKTPTVRRVRTPYETVVHRSFQPSRL